MEGGGGDIMKGVKNYTEEGPRYKTTYTMGAGADSLDPPPSPLQNQRIEPQIENLALVTQDVYSYIMVSLLAERAQQVKPLSVHLH